MDMENFFGYGSGVEKSISVHLWCLPLSSVARFQKAL